MMSKKALPKKPLAHTLSQPIDAVEYVVSSTDTLPGIAARFDTVPSELTKLNKLTSRLIFPGQGARRPFDNDFIVLKHVKVLLVPTKKTDTDVKESEPVCATRSLSEGESNAFSPALVVTENDRQSNISTVELENDKDIPRFLKIRSRYITDGQGVVAGILIITPNAVMFDPNVSDPLVIEHGAENYGVIAPISMVMRAAIYYDIAHMAVSHLNEVPRNIPKPEMYEKKPITFSDKANCRTTKMPPKNSEKKVTLLDKSANAEEADLVVTEDNDNRSSSLVRSRQIISSEDVKETPKETGDETVSVGVESSVCKKQYEDHPHKLSRANRANSCCEPIESSDSKDAKELTEQKRSSESGFIEQSIMQDKTQTSISGFNSLDSSEKRTNETLSSKLPSISSFDCKTADNKANLFEALDQSSLARKSRFGSEIIAQPRPAISHDPPLYLCLRMGRPINREAKKSSPFLAYHKKQVKREYWFSVSQDRVADVYDFLHHWVPHIYGDIIDIEPQALGFVPIDEEEAETESVDEEELNQESVNNSFEGAMKLLRASPLSILKVVEDHFGGGNISKEDWEFLQMSDNEKSPSAESVELPLPELSDQSDILSDEQKRQLCNHLPARAIGYPWTLIYSTCKHGFSLKTLYRKMSSTVETPVLLAICDTNGAIFGALSSCSLKVSDHFYGTGESFLYSFVGGFKRYPWSGDNMFFIKGNHQSLAIGAGEGHFGLWLDGDLYHGSSRKCRTFNNECLASQEDFVIKGLEAWGFV